MFPTFAFNAYPHTNDRRVLLVLDYSEKSSQFLRNFIEAKKILELRSLMSIDYDYYTIGKPMGGLHQSAGGEAPLLYIDGVLVSYGKVPTVEELVSLLLNPRPVENVERNPELGVEGSEPPWFGSAAFAVAAE